MKLLVVGASGLVGWNLGRVAQREGHDVLGTYASHALPKLEKLEIGDKAGSRRLLEAFQPDAVACCAAWSWVDGCQQDPARAFRTNAEEPAALARASHERGARFVYFSTSYVFDGEHGPYDEDAIPHPISVYGESKLKGERLVAEATGGTALILRTMGVYGEEPQQKNFVYQVVRALRAGKEMKIPSDQRGNATSADDLAALTVALLAQDDTGVWNAAGPDPDLARADFAQRIAREYDLDASLLTIVPTAKLGQSAPRPQAGGLIIDRAVARTGYRPARWRPFLLDRQI